MLLARRWIHDGMAWFSWKKDGTREGTRTLTTWILSPIRMPIPSPEPMIEIHWKTKWDNRLGHSLNPGHKYRRNRLKTLSLWYFYRSNSSPYFFTNFQFFSQQIHSNHLIPRLLFVMKICMVRVSGIEPLCARLKVWCLTTRLHPHVAWVDGFEPSIAGVKVLCLTVWLHPNV